MWSWRKNLPHNLQHTFQELQVEEDAIWYQLGSRSVSTKNASAHEVVVDDFVVVGFGDMQDEAVKDHDKNLDFLQQCVAK